MHGLDSSRKLLAGYGECVFGYLIIRLCFSSGSVRDEGQRMPVIRDLGASGKLASALDVEVLLGVPQFWDEVVGATPAPIPATITEHWLRLAPKRLPGERVTISLRQPSGQREVSIHGSLMDGPSGNSRIDPYAIFSGASAGLGLVAGGPHPWRSLKPQDVYPCLLLMMPHYESLPVGSGAKDPAVCAALVAELRTWAVGRGLRSIAFEYLTPEAAALTQALRAADWPVVEMADRCDLDVSWTDFNGYLNSLSSRRRVRIRRELRALEEHGVRIEARRLRADEPDLIDLRCQLVAKYGGVPDPAKEAAMMQRLREEFDGDDITVVSAEGPGGTLGFGVFVQDGTTWMPTLAGSDYTDPMSRLTYFATLFYKPAELAPALGIRTIPYGLGSWQAKQLRGCTAAPLHGAALLLDEHS